MLKKNVYILYPPGYSGNFINWAINASDSDQALHTVKNPINTTASKKLGAAGTSHLHVRIPTHQGSILHLLWTIRNRPSEYKVYILNSINDDVASAIHYISTYDDTGIFINVHNNDNNIIDAYGAINAVTKWPISLEIVLANKSANSRRQNPFVRPHEHFDPHNCQNDRLFRNWVVRGEDCIRRNKKLNRDFLDLQNEDYNEWFNIRNRDQPHEVNESMYTLVPDLSSRIFELSTLDIATDNFLPWFEDFMLQSQVSDGWDTSTVQEVHPEYIKMQTNLQWFESIAQWEQTGKLDSYLTSHSVIEAEVIKRIFQKSNIVFLNEQQRNKWIAFYTNIREDGWPDKVLSEYQFYSLPQHIQDVILESGYIFNTPGAPCQELLNSNWENLSLEEINQIYQEAKSRIGN